MTVSNERIQDKAIEVKTSVQEASDEQLMPSTYGEKRIMPVKLRDLVILSQVRDTVNPVKKEIKDSIWQTGELINQIDVARLTREEFEFYVNFVNRIWGSQHVADDYLAAEDGYIYLVMAGHTRAESMIELEDDKALERTRRGLPPVEYEAETHVKIKEGLDPMDVLQTQWNENIHHMPPQERQAMFIVENYQWGLSVGRWSSKTEYLEFAKKRFGKGVLYDALHFADLPSEIRDFVFNGGIPYRAGVELGKTVPLYREYARIKYFNWKPDETMSDEERQEFEGGIFDWLVSEVTHIQHARMGGKSKFGGAIIKGRYEAFRQEFAAFIEKATGSKETPQMVFAMADPLDDFKNLRRRMRYDRIGKLRELGAEPLGRMAALMNLHLELLGRQGDPELAEELLKNIGDNFLAAVKKHKSLEA